MTARALPSVTVVVPVWDRYCELLRESVESALAQPGVPIEVVVVDNASSTPLPALPEGVGVVRLPARVHVGTARNVGLARVRSPYVTFLDADDVLLPGALESLTTRLEDDRRAVTACGRFVTWNASTNERRIVRRAPRPVAVGVSRLPRAFAAANLAFNSFPVVGCVHRVDAVRRAGGFADASVGEDWVLGAMLCFQGRIRFSERPTFLRRVHEGSLWYQAHDPEALLEAARVLHDRARHDPAVPAWTKMLLPVLARVHRRSLERAVNGGIVSPSAPLITPEGTA